MFEFMAGVMTGGVVVFFTMVFMIACSRADDDE